MSQPLPLKDHLNELRRFVLYVFIVFIAAALIAFNYNSQIFGLLLRPLGQPVFYTSPIGGFSLAIKVALLGGFLVSLPFAIFFIFKFIEPAFTESKSKKIFVYSIFSFLLTFSGIGFAYFFCLPATLAFLNKFEGNQIKSLITAQEYLSFLSSYLAGFALFFQMPLVIIFINSISRLSTKKLIKNFRWVLLGSFILAAVFTPTPDPFNQALVALPIILLYLISIFIVWIINKRS